MSTVPIFVGIDISKDRPDIALRPTGEREAVVNAEADIAVLVARLQACHPTLIVLEATGGFELAGTAALAAAQQPVVVVNPRQVRDFAKATGQPAKTDALDAAILAQFAEAVRTAIRALPNATTQALAALPTCQRQLVTMRTAESNRLGTALPPMRKGILAHLAWLDRQLAQLDDALTRAILESPV